MKNVRLWQCAAGLGSPNARYRVWGLLGVSLWAGAAQAGVVDPYLRTDRSADTRSAKTIVGDLVRPEMTDEEKVLAIFHWTRRVIFHSGPEDPVFHNFNNMINIFGHGSCYLQTHPLSHLLQQAGFPCKNWIHNTHHMLEVYCDGAWHCMDPHMTFYVYTRGDKPTIASIAQLQEDETLAGDAVKEKRTGPAFLICGDKPTWFSGKGGWTLDHPFLPHVGSDVDFGGITLRRGETYVRTWKMDKFLKTVSYAFDKDGKTGPYHTCGAGSDRRDPINLPYWEPYHQGGAGRHFGTGYLDYTPDLRKPASWQEGTLRHFNFVSVGPMPGANMAANNAAMAPAPALHPAAGGIESEVIFTVKTPYVVTAASLNLAGRLGDADALKVSVSKDWVGKAGDRKWVDVHSSTEAGQFRKDVDLSSVVEGALEGYWVRITLKARDPQAAGLDGLKLHTDFQLNPYALPQLLPGKNKLMLSAARNDTPWKFRLAWSEGEGWKTSREYKAQIQGASHEATVEAAGPKFPRMESIEFSVAP